MGRPLVEHFNTNLLINTPVAAVDLFSEVDPEGDAIMHYDIEDYQSDPTSGFFRVNGVAIPNGTQFRVAAEDLGSVEYVAGSRISREGFRVIATDINGDFSDATAGFGVIFTTRENITPPNVQNIPFTALANEATPIAPFVSAFDPDGFEIIQFSIRDTNVDSGFLTLDGNPLPQGQFTAFTPAELNRVSYNTTGPASTEQLEILAFDGQDFSAVQSNNVTTIPNVNRPVAQFVRADAISRDTIPLIPVSNIVDDDTNSIKFYEFWNTSPHATHGEILVNGSIVPRREWVRVTSEDTVEYLAPNRDLVQQIRYRGGDGLFLSNNSTISITTEFVIPPIQPELTNGGTIIEEQLVELPIDQLFTRADSGNETIRYQLYDGNGFDQLSSRFEFNSNELDALTIHDFTAAEVDQFVRLTTGDFNSRHDDPVLVRAQNADGLWSAWSKLQVRTEPEFRGAIAPTSLWTNVPGITTDATGRLELSYSFTQDFPDGNTGEAVDNDAPENYSPFNQEQRIAVRRAFDEYERITNVNFVEVSDTSTNVLGQRGGIYRFSNYGLIDSNAAAFAFFPGTNPEAGDSYYNRIFLGTPFFDANGDIIAAADPTLTPFTGAFTTLLHELLHNFGFNHVFEDANGTATLPVATRNDNFSVLSTFTGERPDGLFPTTPQLYDTEAVQQFYGVNNTFNSGDTLYGLDDYWSENPAFTENLFDGGGIDTLSLAGSDPTIGRFADGTPTLYGNAIDLSPGGFSTFNGFNENVSIAFRADIENAIGSVLEDTIVGNALNNEINSGAGNDIIEGSTGDDTLTGAEGNDLFIFGVGDGNDVIDEQTLAGRDTIELTEFPTLDSLQDDIRFQLDGRDLIIDLRLDNSNTSEGSIRITDHIWGGSRIETLELNGTRIDLRNLSDQITATTDTFQLTDASSVFGNLVVPV